MFSWFKELQRELKRCHNCINELLKENKSLKQQNNELSKKLKTISDEDSFGIFIDTTNLFAIERFNHGSDNEKTIVGYFDNKNKLKEYDLYISKRIHNELVKQITKNRKNKQFISCSGKEE